MRWLVALALATLAAQSPAAPGRVTGVVTDSAGGVIPGATITLRSEDFERTTVTDARGSFMFDDVPRGRYAVIATLQGLYGEPRTDVVVSGAVTVSLKLQLETDCLAIVDHVDMGLARTSKEADLVAHVRILPTERPIACSIEGVCTCTLHQARVIRALKGPAASPVRLLQENAGGTGDEQPYVAGDEFVAFLKRDKKNLAFARLAGPTYMLRVRDGRVQFGSRVPPGLRDGMTVTEFATALRAAR